MDAAKHVSCEGAAALVEELGPVAAGVVIELRDVSPEAFARLKARFGAHPLDTELDWHGDGAIVTRTKHIDFGSGVLANVSYIDASAFHDTRKDDFDREQMQS